MLSYSLLGPHWGEGLTVTYSFIDAADTYPGSSYGFSDPFDATEQTLTQQALAAWSAVSGITFQQVPYQTGYFGSASTDLIFGFIDYGSADLFPPNQYQYYNGPSTAFGGYDPVFLADPAVDPLTDDGNGVLRYGLDGASFEQATLAAIGYAIGLDGSNDPASVMYGSFSAANAALDVSDQAGAQALYGPAPGQPAAQSDFFVSLAETFNSDLAAVDITLDDPFASYIVHPGSAYDEYGGMLYPQTLGADLTRSDGATFSTQDQVDVLNFSDGIYVLDETGGVENVARLYLGALGSIPDAATLLQVASSYSYYLQGAAQLVLDSTAYTLEYGTLSNTQFVTDIYQDAVGRAPDPGGLAAYVGYLNAGVSRADVLVAMSESQESKVYSESQIGDADRSEVYRLYQTVLGTAPSEAQIEQFAPMLDNGTINPDQIAADLLSSSQYAGQYGDPSNSDFVNDLYLDAAHRPADPGGLATYVQDLNDGLSRAALATFFANSDDARSIFAAATNDGLVHVPG